MADHLSEFAEFYPALCQHVAPGIRGQAIYATFRPYEGADAFCGPSSSTCHQRVCVFGVREFGRGGDGWPGRVGSNVDLARKQGPLAARCDHSISRFTWLLLQRIHELSGISAK